jgi:hypothetical protein
MARQKKSRYYPVQSKIKLNAPAGSPAATSWMAIAPNLLSMMNRRHYPATGVYDVKMDLNSDDTDTSVEIYALKDNWDTIGAIRLAYKMFQKATSAERAQLGSEVARWEDFRIAHGTGLTEAVPMVYNVGIGASNLTIAEFSNSQVVDEVGNTKIFTLQGADSPTQYNILANWSATGNVDASPASVTSATSYGGLDDVDAGQGDRLAQNNNLPPYDRLGDDGLQSPWAWVARLGQGGANTGTLSTGYFRAPLGMVLIVSTDTPNRLTMTVREGSHKGIKVHDILG